MRLFALLLTLCACAPNLPDLDSRISAEARRADYPVLMPLPPLLAAAETTGDAEARVETLSARVAALRRRAAALKGRSVIDGATRLRLIRAGAKGAL